MRVVLDTNIIVSALIAPAGRPAAIIDAWLDGKFTLLTCAAHVEELRATLQSHGWPNSSNPTRPAAWSTRSKSSPLIRCRAWSAPPIPRTIFFWPCRKRARADYLVTGDKSGLLALGRHKGAQIVSAHDFAALVA